MIRHPGSILVLALLLSIGCAKKPPVASQATAMPAIVHQALGVAAWNRTTSYILHMGPDAKGVISEEKKGDVRPLITGIAAPHAFAVDSRRAQFYVIDGARVAIYKIRKPAEAPQIVEIGETQPLSDITFSIINRRAYLVSPEGRSIWIVNPVSGKAEQIAGPDTFSPETFGKPTRLIVSVDGMRLYIVTVEPSQLVEFDLHRRKVAALATLPDVIAPTAVDLYKEHFIVTDGATGEVFAIHRKKYDVSYVDFPPEAEEKVLSAVSDDVGLLLLMKEEEGDQAKLIRVPFKIEKEEEFEP